MSVSNPMCDGSGPCDQVNSEVRVLPLGRNPHHGNLILCFACFNREMIWRRQRNYDLAEDCRFEVPAWKSLKVYGGVS